jgi:hypothetical protein
MQIEWMQVIVAYILGGLTFAMLKSFLSGLKSKVTPA